MQTASWRQCGQAVNEARCRHFSGVEALGKPDRMAEMTILEHHPEQHRATNQPSLACRPPCRGYTSAQELSGRSDRFGRIVNISNNRGSRSYERKRWSSRPGFLSTSL